MKKLESVLKSQDLKRLVKTDAAKVEKPLRGATQKCVSSSGGNGCG